VEKEPAPNGGAGREIAMALKEYRKPVGDITLNIREGGSGRLIVFMHGITANAAVWEPILLGLSDDFHVVSIDQRGHGHSDKPASGYRAADYVRDVMQLIDIMGSGQALIVGHSLGARNAIVAGATMPEKLAGIVAIDFTPFIEDEVFDALDMRVRGGDRPFGSYADIVAYLADRYPLMPKDAVERRAHHGYAVRDGSFTALADPAAMAETVVGLRTDLEGAIRDVKPPMLLIRGAESKLVSSRAFDRTLQLRADVESLVVPGVDHYVPEEAPVIISDAVRKFADRLQWRVAGP
jgi:2-(acetamidomethylene)succinate hydrolase